VREYDVLGKKKEKKKIVRKSSGNGKRCNGNGSDGGRRKVADTYISLQIIVSHVRFHADEVSEHAQHDILAEDDDLLPEEF
jgi:hypothetical protein